VGAVLYHLLAGRPPFEEVNELATLNRVMSSRPPLPLPSPVPASFQAVVSKALSFDPAARYATASELQRAIEGAMAEAGVTTTTADVAAFAQKYLPDRAEARRQAIDLALSAATERARVQTLLKPTSDESSSSIRNATKAPTGSMPLAAARAPAGPSEVLPLSESSSTSLGAAGSMGSAAGVFPPRRAPRIASAAAIALAVGAALLTLPLRRVNHAAAASVGASASAPAFVTLPPVISTPSDERATDPASARKTDVAPQAQERAPACTTASAALQPRDPPTPGVVLRRPTKRPPPVSTAQTKTGSGDYGF
jgi:serine/threonine protein kinase